MDTNTVYLRRKSETITSKTHQKDTTMAKVIGIGETVFDIIFDENNQPVSGKPGGSVYNALISLGRSGVEGCFISEVGNDKIGSIIRNFLTQNGIDSTHVCSFADGKSPLALAFLDENRNAQYTFYKDYPKQRLAFDLPQIESDDIVLIGSYFALMPALRPQVKDFLKHARKSNCTIYYDVNFRATHCHEVDALMPTMIENFEIADIVKGSDEDFENIFGTSDFRRVYQQHIRQHCPIFICTQGSKGATLMIGDEEWHVEGQRITPVSTIGAGDSFNAGTVYGLLKQGLPSAQLPSRGAQIAEAMKSGIDFASEVCQSYDNYIADKRKR